MTPLAMFFCYTKKPTSALPQTTLNRQPSTKGLFKGNKEALY